MCLYEREDECVWGCMRVCYFLSWLKASFLTVYGITYCWKKEIKFSMVQSNMENVTLFLRFD